MAIQLRVADQSKRKMRAKVAFSYMPENEDELRLEVGDTVEIIKQVSDSLFHVVL